MGKHEPGRSDPRTQSESRLVCVRYSQMNRDLPIWPMESAWKNTEEMGGFVEVGKSPTIIRLGLS